MVKLIVGVNDLKTWCKKNNREDLLEEWDYEANNPLKPENFSHGSNKKVFWKCKECGRKWPSRIANRTKKDNPRGCSECSKKSAPEIMRKRRIENGGSFYNWCLKNNQEQLLKEWNDEKNLPLTPKDIPWGNTKEKIWWNCPFCGETYQSRLDHRRNGNGHRYCKSSSYHNSDAEIGVYYYCCEVFGKENVISNYNDYEKGITEIDIFIPSINVGIEYDGEGYHSNIDRDLKKDESCEAVGITLYRIREPHCPMMESSSICILRTKTGFNDDYDNCLKQLFLQLGKDVDINSLRDQGYIIELRGKQIDDNSLASKFPEIAKEWNYEKNAPLTPKMVSYGAEREVWWICSNCGETYPSFIYSRTGKKKHSCPHCKYKKVGQLKWRAIKQYSLNGEFINEYESLTKAYEMTGIPVARISACCKKRYHTAGGFVWRYKDDLMIVESINKSQHPDRYYQSIKQYSLDGFLIKEYASIIEAEQVTQIKASNIYRNAVGERKSASGYMWKFSNDSREVTEYKTNIHNKRKVSQYSLEGEYIASFESVLEAGRKTNTNEASIRDCCSGRNKTAGGYVWKYNE